MRQCIPSKNVFIRSAPLWLTSDIKRLIKCKSRLFRRAKRSNSIQVWEKCKSTRNKLVSAARSAKVRISGNWSVISIVPRTSGLIITL